MFLHDFTNSAACYLGFLEIITITYSSIQQIFLRIHCIPGAALDPVEIAIKTE